MRLCAGVVAGSAQGSISVTADNVCSRAGTLQLDYTKEVLEYRIDVIYLTHSLYELNCDVTLSPCSSSSSSSSMRGGRRRHHSDGNDVVVTVTISGDYQSVLFSLTLQYCLLEYDSQRLD